MTSIVNGYSKIIVLEDDIVTSKYFLKYMNDALEVYKDTPKVMAISGYAYINDCENLSETYFCHLMLVGDGQLGNACGKDLSVIRKICRSVILRMRFIDLTLMVRMTIGGKF